MESAKLKNIILVILVITNALLLGLLVNQRMDSRHQHQKVLTDATELLAQRGIALDRSILPDRDFPAAMVLKQDLSAQGSVFSALLGQDATFAQRGLVWICTGSLGRAEVRENGDFTVELTPEAYPLEPGGNLASHALDILKRYLDFSGQSVSVQGDTVTVTQSWEGCPVFSCQVELVYQEGSLVSIRGTRLPGTPTADTQSGQPLSLATLLVRFRSGIIDSGDACTAILSATQGYTLSSDAGGGLRLTPVLRLETDTGAYLLNALTGELRRG